RGAQGTGDEPGWGTRIPCLVRHGGQPAGVAQVAGESAHRLAGRRLCDRRSASGTGAVRREGRARMNEEEREQARRPTVEGVRDDLQRQPYLLVRLAENALTVAESLRDNYFKNTAEFITALRKAMYAA